MNTADECNLLIYDSINASFKPIRCKICKFSNEWIQFSE